MAAATERCLTLRLSSHGPFLNGATVQAVVEINLKQAQEDDVDIVTVKIRGGVHTMIRRSNGQSTHTYHDAITFIRINTHIWRKGEAFSADGSDIVQFPIAFTLPNELPPSFYVSGRNCRGSCLYQIEVHGSRPGIFQSRRKLRFPITVLPPTDSGFHLRQSLLHGPLPQMTGKQARDMIRTGIFGEKSNVEATLYLPDVTSFPAFAPIPFRLEVLSVTKEMDATPPKDMTQIFPSMPDWLSIELYCKGYSHIKVRRTFGGLTQNPEIELPLKYTGAPVERIHFDPVWVAQRDSKSGNGRWRQQVQFVGSFTLNVTPTFTTDILSTEYAIKAKIPFKGIGNKLEIRVPVHVNSGLSFLAPAVGSDQPLPTYEQGLPPAYFGADNEWPDEKA